MGLCWSSPPVVEQEVELPDLENQLSAPKPRPTATSWTHKPAILIPATLVCLILSGFALSIFVGYNSMSDPTHRVNDLNIQTDGANQPPGQFDLLIPENQTSLDANTTPTDPDPRKSGFMSIPNTPVKVKPEHVDLGSQTKTPLTSISSAPGNSSFKTNEDKIVPIQSDNTPIIKTSPESEPTPLTDLIRVPSAPKPAIEDQTIPIVKVEDQAKPIESIQTGGANLPSEQVYLPNSLNLKNKTPSDANTIPPPFDNTIATGLQSQATDHQNADTNP
eukprot:116813_1